MTHRMTSSSNS